MGRLENACQQLGVVCLLLSVTAARPSVSAGQVLLHDDFNGSSLDMAKWELPSGVGTFFGRTQIRPPTMPPDISGGFARLKLDTHNPTALTPGDSFWGAEIRTKEFYQPSTNLGLAFEAHVRIVDNLNNPVPRGLVGGIFTFVTDGVIRDEIDFELLTNDINDGNERVLTNVFENDNFSQPGDKTFADVSGLDMTQLNTYRLQWWDDRVEWFVNDQLVREEFDTVPDEAMNFRLNIWAPDQFFVEAFDASLQPVDNTNDNQSYFFEVDFVTISRVPEPSTLILAALGLLGLCFFGGRYKRVAT